MLGKRGLERREMIDGYLFAAPWIIGFLVFTLGPMIASLVFSCMDYSVYRPPEWLGLENYIKILTDDSLFLKSLTNTIYYTFISVPLCMALALGCAILLNQNIPLQRILRTVYYLPAVTSGVAVSFLWMWILDPSLGFINRFLELIGIQGPLWLQCEHWAKPALILMSTWAIGQNIVIYLAGLQGIPQHLYEAAMIDGANTIQKFRHITLPMMSPTLFFTLVMGIIGTFQVFTQAYVMTEGGPMNATLFYVLYLYRCGFVWLRLGYASALAWILFVIVLFFTLLVIKSSPMWVYYEASRSR